MSVPDTKLATEETAGGNVDHDDVLDAQVAHFMRHSYEPMLATDGRGRIVLANVHAALLLGCSEHELAGQPLDRVIPGVSFDDGAEPQPEPGHGGAGAYGCADSLGIEAYPTPLSNDPQAPVAWVLRTVSSTGRHGTLSAARLNEAQRIASIGNWEWDVVRDEHWWSEELYRILEIAPEDRQEFFSIFKQRIHPEDRDRFERTRELVLTSGEPQVLDVRIVLPDGREKIVQSQGTITRDEQGRVVRMSGTLQDVTEHKVAESALLQTEARYKEAQRIAMMGNWEWDAVSNTSWWSDELYAILEENRETYPASLDNFLAKVAEPDREIVRARATGPMIKRESYAPMQVRLSMPDGRRKIVEMRVDMRTDTQGRLATVSGTVRDVTERWELQALLRDSEERYASTVELAAIGIAHVDAAGRFVWANQHLCAMLGYSKEELLGLTIAQISHPEDPVNTAERDALHSGKRSSLKFEKRYVRKDGVSIWVRVTCAPRHDRNGNFLYDISAVEDVTDRKTAEARVQYLATHDEMTGLPNRILFNELLGQTLERAQRRNRSCSVLFIDLDRFKIVNDSLGHDAGDTLLKEMAARFKQCIRARDVIARLGGDEFVVLLSAVRDAGAAAHVARKIISQTLRPLEIKGHECRVTASVGIATYPSDARDPATLLKLADMAMYQAKEEGKNNYQFYSAHTSPMSVERLILESHLRHALEQDEFTVHYQPKLDLRTGTISGAEALLRWWNSELGTVSPAQFIPLAEDTGLIVPIGRWILREACRQNVAWYSAGLPRLIVAVNLSPRQFKDPGLLDDIVAALEETGMAPQLLELEITESMIMHDVDRAVERAAEIKGLGVRLAIDDFGTGYSSLSQLKRFPIDTLKIDRSFVRDIGANAEDRAITEAIVSLGHTLGVTVIAEGVETEAQLQCLRQQGCDEIQGFYFSKPCHFEALADLLRIE